jgi:ubiquinone/menaquinone biosynthesis C-methylase UbiE
LHNRVCPWWLGYMLVSPLRRLLYDPEKMLRPYIGEGMNVLDIGCGMGFFSIPAARMVGKTGKVVCVDLQGKMIRGLLRRSDKAGLSDRIDARVCQQDALALDDLAGKIDFALAFALIHEVRDKERLLSEISAAMKQNGRLLISEPKGHVSRKSFDQTVSTAEGAGFRVVSDVSIRRSYAALLIKKGV